MGEIVMERDSALPELIDFGPTFRAVVDLLLENGYSGLTDASSYAEAEDKAGFDAEVDDLLMHAMRICGLIDGECGDWKGELHDVLEEAGVDFASWDEWEDDDHDE